METTTPMPAISRGLWSLAVGSILVWLPILALTQPEQRLRWEVEHNFQELRLGEGIETMKTHPLAEFPPHWEPPPRVGFGESHPDVFSLLRAALDQQAPEWVFETYLAKLEKTAGDYERLGPWGNFENRSDEELREFLAITDQLPRLRPIFARRQRELQAIVEDMNRPEDLRDQFLEILKEVPQPGVD